MKWDSITREELLNLYVNNNYTDRDIANLFSVTKAQVSYKRKKLDITRESIAFVGYMLNSPIVNNKSRDIVFNADINAWSKVISHYIFRNGPVEQMHSDGKLSDEDMYVLNKYMNDRIGTLLYLLKTQDWNRLCLFFEGEKHNGSNWEDVELKVDELDRITAIELELAKK